MRSRVITETDCGVSRNERLNPVAVAVESALYEASAVSAPSTCTFGSVVVADSCA
jgi:hypothetical protein